MAGSSIGRAVPTVPIEGGGRAVVVGAGISGATTALELGRSGIDVTLVAQEFGSATAAGLVPPVWDWPVPETGAGFARRRRPQAPERVERWAAETYARLMVLALDPRTGIDRCRANVYLDRAMRRDRGRRHTGERLREVTLGYAEDALLLHVHGVNRRQFGLTDAYRYLAPVVDTERYLQWLMVRLVDEGVRIRRCHLADPTELRAVADDHDAEVVVNCAGLGASRFTDDPEVRAQPGAWAVVPRWVPGLESVQEVHTAWVRGRDGAPTQLSVAPLGDRLVLGMTGPGRAARSVDTATMIRLCTDLVAPQLAPQLGSSLVARSELRVGVIAARTGGGRVQLVDGPLPMVHNYGHGPASLVVSWGAAGTAARLALHAIREQRRTGRPAVVGGRERRGLPRDGTD